MSKLIVTILLCVVVLISCLFLFSCEKNYITQAQEEHVGDYHLLYNYIGGDGTDDDPALALEFSTKTGEVVDTIKTPFLIINMRYSNDGAYAVYRVFSESNNKTIITMNNLTGDTLASISENYGSEFFFGSDMQTLMITGSDNFAILTFPNLDSIYVEEIITKSGGFMTDGKTAFYMVAGVDSLFFIDYSDSENIIRTSTPTKNYGTPLFPIMSAVDLQNERLLILYEYGDRNFIRIHDSNDFSILNELDVPSRYKIQPVVRPGTDEVYLGTYSFPGEGYIDVYDFSTNVLTSFLTSDNVIVNGGFDPFRFEFTPDGKRIYIIYGATIPPQGILGVDLQNGSIIQQFGPGLGYSMGGTIGINPIDFSE